MGSLFCKQKGLGWGQTPTQRVGNSACYFVLCKGRQPRLPTCAPRGLVLRRQIVISLFVFDRSSFWVSLAR